MVALAVAISRWFGRIRSISTCSWHKFRNGLRFSLPLPPPSLSFTLKITTRGRPEKTNRESTWVDFAVPSAWFSHRSLSCSWGQSERGKPRPTKEAKSPSITATLTALLAIFVLMSSLLYYCTCMCSWQKPSQPSQRLYFLPYCLSPETCTSGTSFHMLVYIYTLVIGWMGAALPTKKVRR